MQRLEKIQAILVLTIKYHQQVPLTSDGKSPRKKKIWAKRRKLESEPNEWSIDDLSKSVS